MSSGAPSMGRWIPASRPSSMPRLTLPPAVKAVASAISIRKARCARNRVRSRHDGNEESQSEIEGCREKIGGEKVGKESRPVSGEEAGGESRERERLAAAEHEAM